MVNKIGSTSVNRTDGPQPLDPATLAALEAIGEIKHAVSKNTSASGHLFGAMRGFVKGA